MPAGFFGKLPSKRDFVAYQTTRPFLDMWEPWLQAGVATARQTLGERWPEAYNRMPIWRFWLGAQFCGEAVVGALMASVDGVGRAFPLAVFCSEGQALLPPPEMETNRVWCEAAEQALLGALAPDKAFEDFAADVDALPAPVLQSPLEDMAGVETHGEGVTLVRGVGGDPALAFRVARRFGHRSAFAGQSFWWTLGGAGFEPLALAVVGLPAPAVFADLVTGAFRKDEADG